MDKNRPWILFTVSTVFFVLVTTAAYYKHNGLKDLMELKVAIVDIKREIIEARLESERYRQEIESLNYSDSFVEAIARESLGLVKPGEVVYEFVDAKELAGPDYGSGEALNLAPAQGR